MIIYSKSTGNTSAAIGKLETPIKMIIERESDLLATASGAVSLFNVEKSNRFGETIVGGNEFSIFSAAPEGGGADVDSVSETYHKFIEHIQFMKEFTITAEMMEDANYGIAVDAKHRAENFVRAYYKTINKLCLTALTNGEFDRCPFGNASLDLTTGDGLPVFHSEHVWGDQMSNKSGVQSNFYYGDIFRHGDDRTPSATVFEESLYDLSVKLRNMVDETGEALGYTADTIILPGNRPIAEAIAKKVCGTPYVVGSSNNDINLHYANWNIVVLPGWQSTDDRLIVMSSEANKNLCGNMFFNRVPLTVTNWVDNHTGNYIWNGRCRFGVGFGSYKHMILAVDANDGYLDSIPM
ncbi:MAG: hypothetical protein IJ459_02805 [Clostridia bacterium]|nr:hypothetical protein [Clostridia bacterium]